MTSKYPMTVYKESRRSVCMYKVWRLSPVYIHSPASLGPLAGGSSGCDYYLHYHLWGQTVAPRGGKEGNHDIMTRAGQHGVAVNTKLAAVEDADNEFHTKRLPEK